MANFKYSHFYTTTSGKEPTAGSLQTAEIALNIAEGSEGLFFKNDKDEVVRIGLGDIAKAIANLNAEVTSIDGEFVTVKVTEVGGKITAVNVTEEDIASAAALNAEITARKAVDGQDGQTYTKNSTAEYISDATSLNDADVKLAAALKLVEGKVDAVPGNITTAIEALDAEVTSTDGEFVTVKVTEVDGKITAVNVSEEDIASETALNAEIGARKTVTGVDADTYTANSSTNYLKTVGSLKAADEALDAALKVVEDNLNAIDVKGDIADAIAELNADETGSSTDKHVTVNVVEEAGIITEVNVSTNDIASATALTAEISARKAVDGINGDTYTVNTGTNYITGATSLNDADVKLDEAIKDLNDDLATVTSGLSELADDVKSLEEDKFGYAEYDSEDKKIYFYASSAATATALCEIDATDFIKDGMVDTVVITAGTGDNVGKQVLKITFNTDADNKEDIEILISDIFNADNYYTKDDVDGIITTVNNNITTISGKVETNTTNIETISGNVITTASTEIATDGKLNLTLTKQTGTPISAYMKVFKDADTGIMLADGITGTIVLKGGTF